MAAKKSFKTEWNPALQFISVPEEEGSKIPEASKPEGMGNERMTPVEPDSGQAGDMVKGSKTPPAGYKVHPLYVETKSRRLQLLMQPSLYERVRGMAGDAGQSVNEWVHARLEEACHGSEPV